MIISKLILTLESDHDDKEGKEKLAKDFHDKIKDALWPVQGWLQRIDEGLFLYLIPEKEEK